jgi:NAD(P)-dependent dehydrogenase (short-subunit alcohol dehydrogenase family)
MASTFDVTDRAQVESVAADVVERFGTVDVLVNNVGLRMRDLYPETWRVTVLESTDADWEASFAVHVLGTLGVIRAFVPPMLAQRRGSIVNIGSTDSLTIRNSPYASTKAALTSVSRYLAQELREQNIAVNVALPWRDHEHGFAGAPRRRPGPGPPHRPAAAAGPRAPPRAALRRAGRLR